jgi:hypothetical protein
MTVLKDCKRKKEELPTIRKKKEAKKEEECGGTLD